MKKYRHKKLGWIIKEQDNGYDATQPNTLITTIPKELIEDSQDRELIEEKEILVPDCIKIGIAIGCNGLGIIKGGQELYYNYNKKLYGITFNNLQNSAKCKLVKVNPKDRETGKIYYSSNNGLKYIEDISYYHLYLGDGNYIYWMDYDGFNASNISNTNYSDRYEVVPFN